MTLAAKPYRGAAKVAARPPRSARRFKDVSEDRAFISHLRQLNVCQTGAVSKQFLLQIRLPGCRMHGTGLLMIKIMAGHGGGWVVGCGQPSLSDRCERKIVWRARAAHLG